MGQANFTQNVRVQMHFVFRILLAIASRAMVAIRQELLEKLLGDLTS
jgi:hypothetical protein